MRRSIKPFLICLLGISICLISHARPLPKKKFFIPPPTFPTVISVHPYYIGGGNQILDFDVTVDTPPPQDVGVYYVVTYYDGPFLSTKTVELYSLVFTNKTYSSTAEVQYTDFYGIKSWYVEFEEWE